MRGADRLQASGKVKDYEILIVWFHWFMLCMWFKDAWTCLRGGEALSPGKEFIVKRAR